MVQGFYMTFFELQSSAKKGQLWKGKASDQFSQVIPNDPWDGSGVLPNCDKALANGDIVSNDEQWRCFKCGTLASFVASWTWNQDKDFYSIWGMKILWQNLIIEVGARMTNETLVYIEFYFVYELCWYRSGGDGDNHICLYPIGDDLVASDIEEGFTITVIHSWTVSPSLKNAGFVFGLRIEFPPDSDVMADGWLQLSTMGTLILRLMRVVIL